MAAITIGIGTTLVAAGAIALAAGFGAFDHLAGDEKPCAWHLSAPLGTDDRSRLELVFNNSVEAFRVRVCVFDQNGVKRLDAWHDIPVAPEHLVVLDAPRTAYYLRLEFDGPYPGPDRALRDAGRLRSTEMGFTLHPEWCDEASVHKRFTVSLPDPARRETWHGTPDAQPERPTKHSNLGYARRPATCGPGGPLAEISDEPNQQGAASGSRGFEGPPALGVGAVATIAGAFVIFMVKSEALAGAGYALFTRLARPKLLEQPTRQRIVEFLTHSPGAGFFDVAMGLGLAHGPAAHHLKVLTSQGLLVRVSRRYFVVGSMPIAKMRALVALQAPMAKAVYEDVASQASTPMLSDVASRLGISRSWASRVARDLEAVGLLERKIEGRRVALLATATPRLQ